MKTQFDFGRRQNFEASDFGGLGLYEEQIVMARKQYYDAEKAMHVQISSERRGECNFRTLTEWYNRFGRSWGGYAGTCRTTQRQFVAYMDIKKAYLDLVSKEESWQNEERLLLQKSTAAAVEEAEHVEELQMTIDHLNSQLRANKNMNITLVDQSKLLAEQVTSYKEHNVQLKETILKLTSERNALISERDSLKTVVESHLGPQEPKTSAVKKVLAVGAIATAGYVGYKMMGE